MADQGQEIPVAGALETQFRLLVQQMPAVVWSTDGQLRLTCCLGAELIAFDLLPEQVLGRTLSAFLQAAFLQAEDPDSAAIAAHRR